jgi:hypothetical protein
MIRKYNLNISYNNNHPVISWHPYPDSIKYKIYKGMSKENMEVIKETNLNQYEDIGTDITTNYDRMKYFYCIGSIDMGDNETIFTEYIQLDYLTASPYLNIIREIKRRHNLILNKIAGEEVDFYIKKQSGERCKECFNELTRDIDTDKVICPTCFNTSFEGGFEKISGKVRIKNANDTIVENPYGFTLEATKQGFISAYPFLNTGDFIRTKQGEIYIIDSVNHKRFQGVLTLQNLMLKILQTTHPYYTIEI